MHPAPNYKWLFLACHASSDFLISMKCSSWGFSGASAFRKPLLVSRPHPTPWTPPHTVVSATSDTLFGTSGEEPRIKWAMETRLPSQGQEANVFREFLCLVKGPGGGVHLRAAVSVWKQRSTSVCQIANPASSRPTGFCPIHAVRDFY